VLEKTSKNPLDCKDIETVNPKGGSPEYSLEGLMPSNHLILCCPLFLLPSIFPSIRVFPMSWLFTSGGQSIGASATASILPMNIQGCLP